MKIYLIRLNPRCAIFYAQAASTSNGAGAEQEPRPGLSGWLERQWTGWRNRLSQSENRIGRGVRALESSLERFVAADEAMFRAFDSDPPELLIYPARFEPAYTRHLWTRYLARERRRNAFWLAINGVLLPPALVLTILPGPNVFGFWFAFRVIGHARALIGIKRARRCLDQLQLEPSPELDTPLDLDPDAVPRLLNAYGLTLLPQYLERHGREAGASVTLVTREHP